jgi:hypothetical protein
VFRFDHKYTPWLNFRLMRHLNSSFLDTICCTIASRYLEPSSTVNQPNVKAQLQGLTEDLVIRMVFNPRISESIEAIQALLILSLWEPIGGPPENEGRDGRVLLASAVSMAMNLRLDQASTKAEALQKSTQMHGGYISEEDVIALDQMLEHARLVCDSLAFVLSAYRVSSGCPLPMPSRCELNSWVCLVSDFSCQVVSRNWSSTVVTPLRGRQKFDPVSRVVRGLD